LDTNPPFIIKSIDFDEYRWGSRYLHLLVTGAKVVPIRVISLRDTFISSIYVSPDSISVKSKCDNYHKWRRGICLDPFRIIEAIIFINGNSY